MKNIVAIRFLSQCIEEIEELKIDQDECSTSYQRWREATESIIRRIFGNASPECKEIDELFHPVYSCFSFYKDMDKHEIYVRRLERAFNKLSGYKRTLEMELSSENECEHIDSLREVTHICSRFSNVIRSIKSRYGNREPLTVNDEYDVQYLLKILLSVSFNDIRSEETVPSFAGGSSRMDFLIRQEGIAIETKMTRSNLNDKEISRQLIQDIAQYQKHPDVRSLVCFIYDPEQFIGNPSGIIDDLESRSNENLTIRVVITPFLNQTT